MNVPCLVSFEYHAQQHIYYVSSSFPLYYSPKASGKRVRRKHDPNAWAASTPSIRTNVLCLGVSYPSVKQQLLAERIDPRVLHYSDEGVDQTVELVQRNILTEMDGRDLVRCLAMEEGDDTRAYWCVFNWNELGGILFCHRYAFFGCGHLFSHPNITCFILIGHAQCIFGERSSVRSSSSPCQLQPRQVHRSDEEELGQSQVSADHPGL